MIEISWFEIYYLAGLIFAIEMNVLEKLNKSLYASIMKLMMVKGVM